MAKTLHIVRHGKASQDYRSIQDYDRPLVEKGIVNNIAVAKRLREQYTSPGLIVSSYAARALHTAHVFASVMNYPHDKVQVNESLYLNGEWETNNILNSLPDELDSVMIVGHNPDVTYVANAFAGWNVDSIPTSGVVSIRFEVNKWTEIDKSKAHCTITFPNS